MGRAGRAKRKAAATAPPKAPPLRPLRPSRPAAPRPDRAPPPGELDPRFIGLLTHDQELTLEFARPLDPEGAVLVADGWIDTRRYESYVHMHAGDDV